MSEAAERVRQALRERGALGEFVVLDEQVPTAPAAAARLGCEVGAIANSLVFSADGEPLLVVTSGAHRVDTTRVATHLGVRKVRRAGPDFVLAATGQEVGGCAPVGHPRPLRTLLDPWLAKHDTIWAGGGDHHTMFATTLDELARITGGEITDVGN